MKPSLRRTIGVALGTLVLFQPASPALAEIQLSSCFVQSPFYQKLMDAGVFNVPVEFPRSGKVEPVDILFRKARMIYYSWDKEQSERWQSADETSKVFRGSCADKGIWLYTHLRRNGYQNVSLIIGRYSPSSVTLHMWVTYEDPSSGELLLLDPTIQKKTWKASAFPARLYKPLVRLSGTECVAL